MAATTPGATRRADPRADPRLREIDLEHERIWTSAWVCAGIGAQIPAPGDLLPVTAGHHGLHVQREPGGTLRAAFNVLQQGSCWTIPAQCGNGHKTRCPYVSCGHARDTDALSAEHGEPTKAMRQFIGFNPLKLVAVDVTEVGPLIFVCVGEPPSLLAQLGPLGSPDALRGFEGLGAAARWRTELGCNWKQAADALFVALGAPRDSGRPVERIDPAQPLPGTGARHRELWRRGAAAGLPGRGDHDGATLYRAFPNVVLALLPNHAATLVIKPIALDAVEVMVGLFAGAGRDQRPDEEAVAACGAGWTEVLAAARGRGAGLGASAERAAAGARAAG
ncbi:MAG: hypothetical protein QOF29_1551 [bacterium]